MTQIKSIDERNEIVIDQLLTLWELSVAKTHTFLSSDDIANIKPDAKNGLMAIEHLYGFFDDNIAQGFIGVQHQKIEMLFVNADKLNQGIGKELLNFAISQLNANAVDVNEQNPQALGFYEHMGFVQVGYSPLDEQGRAFPIIHLALS